MLASVYRGNKTLEVDTIAVPEIDADEVLVEVSHCGICGTDLHFFMEDWGTPGATGGHEWSGVVVGGRARAAELGAAVITPDELPATPRLPMTLASETFDAAFECSGRVDAIESAFGVLGRQGVLVLAGTGRGHAKLDPLRIISNELVVT